MKISRNVHVDPNTEQPVRQETRNAVKNLKVTIPMTLLIVIVRSHLSSLVASLGWVSPGAATEGVAPI